MVAGDDQRLAASSGYRALSYRFAVHSDDDLLRRQAEVALGALRDSGAAGSPVPGPTHQYALRASLATPTVGVDVGVEPAVDAMPGAVDVWRDGELLARHQGRGDALGWIVWDVNRSAVETSGQHLLFHAAALEVAGTGVLLPGASGSGKSTLAAALARAGTGYLTDELAALDLGSGELRPYPKPITVKPGSFAVLADMAPRADGADAGWDGAEWQVPVGGATTRRVGRACVPGLVVLPRYDGDSPTALAPLSDTEAFFALALHAVNLLPHGAAGMAALGALAAGATCLALTFSDLDAACDLVLGTVANLDRGLDPSLDEEAPALEASAHAG